MIQDVFQRKFFVTRQLDKTPKFSISKLQHADILNTLITERNHQRIALDHHFGHYNAFK